MTVSNHLNFLPIEKVIRFSKQLAYVRWKEGFNVWDFFTYRLETTSNSETERQLAIINNTKLFYTRQPTSPTTWKPVHLLQENWNGLIVFLHLMKLCALRSILPHLTMNFHLFNFSLPIQRAKPPKIRTFRTLSNFPGNIPTTGLLSACQVPKTSSPIPIIYPSRNHAVYTY